MYQIRDYITVDPGPETGEAFRAWQGCPTIARTRGGRLFAGWYTGGLFEPCIENFNVLVQSDDNGETWSRPVLAVYSDRKALHRNIDIQLWIDEKGRLWVMWTHSPYKAEDGPATIRTPFDYPYHKEFTGVEVLLCKDPDADVLKWEEPREICFGFLRCKPIRLPSGRYIFPAYDWVHEKNYMLRLSDDGGENFYDVTAARKPDNQVFDETMVFDAGSGKIGLLARTIRGYYAYAESQDDGLTWSETREFDKAPSTRMYIGRLKCGLLAYVRNCSDTERTGMKILLSDDDGASFKWSLTLDTRENVSYPDLCEDEDGFIYIVYDRERDNRIRLDESTWHSDAAKEILLSKIKAEDIRAGRLVTAGAYTARVISKGLVDTVDK